jgi:predicted transcriptional regulator
MSAKREDCSSAPDAIDDAEIAALDRLWAEIESGAVSTVPHQEVARWLETWGTPDFKPWHSR